MEKLINLRHLDIRNTSRLKIPLHPGKLKSLHVLLGAKFLLGGCSGSRMEDLGELHNLYGSLSILELQNVVDRREAQKASMREKNHVEKLSLEWSESIADNSQTERDLLDELHPLTNIEELQITGNRGTKFPNWLADHLGMHRITEVTEEFYGSSSSKKPFNSLEKLEFAEMPEWKQWHVLGNGEFPKLHDLSINCSKLIGKLPENLCCLTGLTISECPELNLETPYQLSSVLFFYFEGSVLFASQVQGMKQIVELSITDRNYLTFIPISILPSTLKRIRISSCGKFKLETPVSGMISSGYCNMFLENLDLYRCDSINDISPELVPRARYLSAKSCQD
ncbi:hypothetical protein RND71_009834 [Anisodus tanguticus]|uniref:R13L1/DRL21-like LRR repeat region domain-containing protein n=1 Tax=Anisodus tanguticus TaxID=243964 RepID=A0AAE1VRL5_9SOLA|nr:hypothetical protein RND71_009834 [Anisodus tanguticus]